MIRIPSALPLRIASFSLIALVAAACQGPPEAAEVQDSKEAVTSPASLAQDNVAPATPLPVGLERAIALVKQQEAGEAYRIQASGDGFVAGNPAAGLSARFDSGMVRVAGEDAAWQVELRLTRWGRDGKVRAVVAAAASTERNKITLARGADLQEWYLNGPLGLEQGFTINKRPAGNGPLVLEMAVGGTLEPRLAEDAMSVTLHNLQGEAVASYKDLWVVDSAGQSLPARLTLAGATLGIRVEDAGAIYPITIDPTLMGITNKVIANDGSTNDHFAVGVSLDGYTALMGANEDDDRGTNSGSAYFFSRSGSAWYQQQKITANDGAAYDFFGGRVALKGNVAVVGAYADDDKGSETGAAYIFTRIGTVWSQDQKLLGVDSAAGDRFGYSVATDGVGVLVGANYEDDKGADAGAAYLFTRGGPGWTQQKKFTASNGGKGDEFGYSVALAGGTALVGARYEDTRGTDAGAAYLFTRSGTTWTQTKMLTASNGGASDDFGHAVTLLDGVALVGAPREDLRGGDAGTAYLYLRSGTVWSQTQKMTGADTSGGDRFGTTVVADGERLAVGAYRDIAYDQGSAYVFSRSGTTYKQTRKLTADDRAHYDYFSTGLGLSGEVVLVGAYGDDDKGAVSGSAYFFELCEAKDEKKLTASDGSTSDEFGYAVAVSGETAVIGSRYDDDYGSNSGSAYVFKRSGSSWTQEQKLNASDAGANDYFGWSVSVSGDTTVVGAQREDQQGSDAGAAYVFARTGTSWSQQGKLTAYDGTTSDYFGTAVATTSDTAVVGSYLDNNARGSDAGAAYVFARTGTVWTHQLKIIASDGAANDHFGYAVAISGNTALIGSRYDDDKGTNSGSAYVYTRSGTSWSVQEKLTASNGGTSDYFGESVSVSGDLAVVGAYLEDHRAGDAGAAYVYARSGTLWSEQQKLTAQDGQGSDWFGQSVAVSGDKILIGARYDDDMGTNSGGAYLYKRSGSKWVHWMKWVAKDGYNSDNFGMSVALSGDVPVVGANFDDDLGGSSGSAYILNTECTGSTGGKCSKNSDCSTGFCVDGVCCNSACGGGNKTDCQACSVAAGAAKDGTCGAAKKGLTCRAAGGACDVAEACDGVALGCPGDSVMSSGTTCRAEAGTCDLAESCDGSSKACPANTFRPQATVCRSAAGDCDMVEQCTGGSAACPSDSMQPAGYACRPASDTCDQVETCTGTSKACPTDALVQSGTVCRQAAGVCDLIESCDGSSKACPADKLAASGAVCRGATGACDLAETCSGTAKACPSDKVQPYNYTCRPSGGKCDVAEACDGSSKACPADQIRASGVNCRPAVGLCDVAETCDGLNTVCPKDSYMTSGSTCRAVAGKCDVAETCSGATATCPADKYMAQGSICRAAAGVCDLAESCKGTLANCPGDVYVPNGTPCQSNSGTCQGGLCAKNGDAGVPDQGAVADSAAEAGSDVGMDSGDTMEGGAGEDTGATGNDKGAGTDAGGTAPPTDESGCDCRVGGQPDGGVLWLLFLGLFLVRRRK